MNDRDIQRFWSKVDKSGECWVWTAGVRADGYGQFWINSEGSNRASHRISYMLAYGPIAAGLVICHRCDNPLCVRAEHLFAGTQADNMADMRAKGRSPSVESLRPREVLRGEKVGTAKLTSAAVADIRRLWKEGSSQKDLGERFGVTKHAIWRIVHGYNWK